MTDQFDIRNSAFGLHPVLATAPRESAKSKTALTCRACRRQDNHTPFNDSDWFRKDDDVRWQYGVPPRGNAHFAWVQHFIHHLAPHGMAGFVLVRFFLGKIESRARVQEFR